MYLKRLYLRGFKSFAVHTELQFHPGVNILVGPNGCGKSNIVDAVRWVLGGIKARELRGQKQEDFIFNGAENIKPQSMARVEMVLDNQDGCLPLEYNEVAVGRTVFRTGETEFQLNHTRVRRKEIQDLFSGTGIGKQGYAVIGQGEVEAVLTGKPWERRMMIEEAAGMIRYRQEREEILHRLLNCEQDCVRLQDLLSELQTRRASLRIKADKAQRRIALDTERHTLAKQVLETEILQRQVRNEERQQQIGELQQKIRDWQEQLQTGEAELTTAALELQAAERSEQATSLELEQWEQHLRSSKNEQAILAERLRHCQQNVAQLEKEVSKNQEQAERIRPDVQSSRQEYAKRQTELEQSRRTLQQQQTEAAALEEEIRKQQQSLTQEQQVMRQVQQQTEQLSSQLEESKNQLLSAQEEKKYQELRFQEQQAQQKEEEQNLQSLQDTLAASQRLQQTCQQQQQQWEQEMASQRRTYEEQKKLTEENERNIHRLQNQIQILQQMMENHALHSDSVRKLLLAAERGEVILPGLLGSVSDVIEVPQPLALAVETALGGAVDYLVSRTAKDASAGIAYLKQHRGGRVTFLPLEQLRIQRFTTEDKAHLQSYSGVIGVASELVVGTAEVRPAVDYLLGRTVIVKTLEEGLKVFRGSHLSIRLVSLEGDVINAGGTMTGGSQNQNRSGILARKARCRQLENEQQEATALWQESVQAFLQTEQAWQEFCARGEQLQHQLQEISIRQQGLKAQIQQQQQKQQLQKQQLQHTEQACIRLQQTVQEKTQLCAAVQAELQQSVLQVQTMQETSGNHEELLKELQKSYALFRERLRGGQEQLLMKEQEARARQVYFQQLEEIQHSYQIAWEQACTQMQEKQQEQQEVQAQQQKLQVCMQEEEQMVAQNRKRLHKLRQEVAALQAQYQSRQQILLPFKLQIDKGNTQIHEKELQKVRLETELEGWLDKWQQECRQAWQKPDNPRLLSSGEMHQRQQRISELESSIWQLGEVDAGAVQEYEQVENRYTFMNTQLEDLQQARTSLLHVLNETENRMEQQFQVFYEQLQKKFDETFRYIFHGGQAKLTMENVETAETQLNRGVEMVVQMPGKRVQNLSLLSGGEKALTGIAFVFALLNLKNAPFCMMDEIDAPLDEVNLSRFLEFVQQVGQYTQFIMISHRQATIASGTVIYGVTMEQRGISRVLSLNLEEAEKWSVENPEQ